MSDLNLLPRSRSDVLTAAFFCLLYLLFVCILKVLPPTLAADFVPGCHLGRNTELRWAAGPIQAAGRFRVNVCYL